MLARSKYNLTKNLTLGMSVNLAQASLAAEKTPKEILTETTVVSLYDAVSHLVGKRLDFRKEALVGINPQWREWLQLQAP